MLSSASIKLNAKPRKKAKKDKDRVFLSQCVGKVMAYLRVGRVESAKDWARKLVEQLTKMGLYP